MFVDNTIGCFFFQAEDGIRDLVRSRGLGDVYKRQEPVAAKADVWPIYQLTKKSPNLTPSYQRGDVWKISERQSLIESILRGVPLPSVILLRTGPSSAHEVVDGKQRLTAILRFVGKHPVALRRIDEKSEELGYPNVCLLYTSPSPRDRTRSRMPSSA